MKRKMILWAVALLIATLVLVGCTAAPQSAGHYGGYGPQGNQRQTTGNTQHGGYGRQNAVADATPANGIIIEESAVPEPPVSDSVAASSGLSADLSGYGSAAALSDSDLTLEDMLSYALQDECLARAEYISVVEALGNVRPFSNIVKAEENHVSQLLPLFEAYSIAPPENDAGSYVVNVTDLTQAYSAGETAELSNIAMYDAFLQQNLPDDVRTVFESLKGASENHLAAFRKHL